MPRALKIGQLAILSKNKEVAISCYPPRISKRQIWDSISDCIIMEFDRQHAKGIKYMPTKFHDNRIRNTVSNLVFTDTRRVAAYSHILWYGYKLLPLTYR